MATKTSPDEFWHIPDELWNLLEPILGPDKAPGTPGRPARPSRLIFEAILYLLRTGCHWHALPRKHFAPPTTVHTRFQHWVEAGVFDTAVEVALDFYEKHRGIAWQWQALDAATTKAPLGGEKTGKSPVDRGKRGTKRSLLVDGRGAPLSTVVTAANRHEKTVALETIDAIKERRPRTPVRRRQHLAVDKGYGYKDTHRDLEERGYIVHGKFPGDPEPEIAPEKKHPARRWRVESTHSWFNRFRRLLVRWEKKADNYEAMISIASLMIVFGLATTAS